MQFHAITLNSVPEASYLTAENAWRYRAIMRTFYLESQKAHIRLNKTELLALLRADGHFAEYTAEQLEQDLNALCSWRNLVPIQDPHRPTSIAEYKNKQFSYSMSQTATEIERMTISLENLDLRTAILSSQLFERILDTLERMTERTGADARTLNQLWDQLQRDFRQLTNRYQDYLRDFYSSHARHILQTTEFLPYKDKVVRYLQEFVLELQRYAEKIRRMLLGLPPEQVETMLQQVYAMQLQEGEGRLIQRSEDYPRQLREEIYGFWQGFYRWFVPGESRQSDSEHVLELANDIIQRILMNAELILQTHSGGANRKVEYKKFLELFAACPTLADGRRLSGMVFGAQRAVHLTGIEPEDLYETGSCYDGQPFLYQLRGFWTLWYCRRKRWKRCRNCWPNIPITSFAGRTCLQRRHHCPFGRRRNCRHGRIWLGCCPVFRKSRKATPGLPLTAGIVREYCRGRAWPSNRPDISVPPPGGPTGKGSWRPLPGKSKKSNRN